MSQKMKQDSCMVYSESQAIVWRCLRDHMYCHFGTKPISKRIGRETDTGSQSIPH